MIPKNKRWFPEDVETLREELKTATLKEVGERYGISAERVRQLTGTGRINPDPRWRHRKRRAANRAKTRELFLNGLTDKEIAGELRVSVGTASEYRRSQGLLRPRAWKWGRQRIIQFAQYWYGKYGFLGVADWHPSFARKMGHLERIERFYQEGAPNYTTVVQRFGSWSEMKRQAGLPPSPRGSAARGVHKRSEKT